ncbi:MULTISPECIES: GTP-binding protein [unclassified Haladaptatus]|uniref:CobW family GTP-binding protein n=1 Tax=unclassified Haladaptatus TaxID=2622732 RepID=UPI0023E7A841|nr:MULTISPECIES: GTP-binding protein [unclassified Haladaptatus]
MNAGTIPVTILSGPLGAGKTTLLNHLLHNAGDLDIAVLVNDMGEINVDAGLVSDNSELSVADGGVTELSNGCICCELQDDLNTAVVRLAQNREFDHLVVESSGISEPEPVARLFTTESRAAALYTVDSLVTVVDSRLFFDTFGGEGVPERRGTDDEDTHPLSDLLVEQVEFSNLVVCNKTDLVSDAELAAVEEMVLALRPDAELRRTTHGQLDPHDLLGQGLYDPQTAAEQAGWKQALAADEDADHGHNHRNTHAHGDADESDAHHGHSHPQDVYGVSSFTYRARRPFHPKRIADLLASLPAGIIRSKGTCWVAGCGDNILTYGQAGPSARFEVTGPWVASLSELDQELYRANRPNLDWHDEWGDRRTELVFIGTDLQEDRLRQSLSDCLLTDAEMDADWEDFENPLPAELEGVAVVAEP